MPDADDFDVEYFRDLLKGSRPQEGHAPTAEPARAAAKKKARPAAKPAVVKKSGDRNVLRKGRKGNVS